MSLSIHDRRVLAEIEQHFMENDPDLALRLAAFGADCSTRRRITVVWRLRFGVLLACAFLTASVMLLIAACVAQNVAVLIAAGISAFAVGAPRLVARLVARYGRRGRRVRKRQEGTHEVL
ncbi:DUF3040 domain-containing protein [Streptomyces sp. NPDC101150]|uniref:DUF3040 domain-containing protein n=1 Tax=Streptomyces sp. NPDC101150 TaxID=3366114 RepID=UPI0037F752BF